MRNPRTKDLPLYYLLGPQLDWLYYNHKQPDQLPNDLTRLRMRLVPLQLILLIVGLIIGNPWIMMASLLILCFQGLTDWIDGYIAYRFGCSSAEGAQLDPRADKLVVLPNLLIFAGWSLATADLVPSLLLLTSVLIAIYLDVASDIWYRHNSGGRSNNFGKIKFFIHITVAAIGVATMIIEPAGQAPSLIAFLCAFLVMAGANTCAQRSLQLKSQSV